MALELVEDAFGDVKNAAFLAAAAQFAYYDQDRGAEAFKNELGLDAKLISVGNTQAYVAHNDNHLVVAFRGSQDPTSIDGLKDWFMTNALNLLIQPEGDLSTEFLAAGVGARWHQGFVNAISAIWPTLYPEVEARAKEKDRVFWVAGHSLGGALAMLGSWLFLRKTMSPHQIYTYGAPMVGNEIVSAAFEREYSGKIFRYVNTPDPVPMLPMMSIAANEFMHAGQLVSVGDGAEAANLIEYIKNAAGGMIQGVLTGDIQEKVWGAIKGKIMAHLLDDYRKLIV
jgi:triacylglycerol lipase